MAISSVGFASATSTTVALPAGTQAGDLLVVYAADAGTTVPSVPSGWVNMATATAGSGTTAWATVFAYKIATPANITAGNVGTWTNATTIAVVVYRGVGKVKFNGVAGATGTTTTVTVPAQTGLAATSWQMGMAGHRNSGALAMNTRTFTSYTTRSSGGASTAAWAGDSNAATTGIVARTATVTNSSGSVGYSAELTASVLAVPGCSDDFDFSNAASITATAGAVSAVNTVEGYNDQLAASSPVQPITGTRTMNGLNVLDFDGIDDYLAATAMADPQPQPYTMIVVFQADWPRWPSWYSGMETPDQVANWQGFFTPNAVYDTAHAYAGTGAAKITGDGTNACWWVGTPFDWNLPTSNITPTPKTFAVLGGAQYAIIGKIYTDQAGQQGSCRIQWYQADGTYISNSGDVSTALTQNAWTDIRTGAFAPSNAAYAAFQFNAGNGGSYNATVNGGGYWLDDVWWTNEGMIVDNGGAQIGDFLDSIVGEANGAFGWITAGARIDSVPHVFGAAFSAGGTCITCSERGTGSGGVGTGAQAGTMYVGRWQADATFYRPFNGRIAEVIHYQWALSAAQLLAQVQQLQAKWGVTVDLPQAEQGGAGAFIAPVGAANSAAPAARAGRW